MIMQILMTLTCLSGFPAPQPSDDVNHEWTDATGKIAWNAELLAASADTVLLRTEDGQLHAVTIKQLSDADQKFVVDYLKSLAQDAKPDDPKSMQTWTGSDGLKLRARVVSYVSQPVSIRWKLRTAYVNDRPLAELDGVYQKMLPKIVAHVDGKPVKTEQDVRRWASQFRDRPRTITVDGVLLRTENGDEFVVPLFLFAEKDRAVLEAGWSKWQHKETSETEKERENFLLRQQAVHHQREQNQEEQRQRQIQEMQLGLMAVNAGITNVWQIQMLPRGRNGRPMNVVVPGSTSQDALATAAQRYPGYVAGSVRELNNGGGWFRYR